MTTPISSTNSCYYDPNAQFTPADGACSGGAPNVAAANPPAVSSEVSIPPVVITGDAGAQELVRQHDAAREPADCSLEAETAALSCGKAGLAAASGIVSTPTVIGAGLAAAATLAQGVECGRDLRAFYDCKTQ
jgi:hypothetical protein